MRAGLLFDDTKLAHLADVLSRAAAARGLTEQQYLDRFDRGADRDDLGAIAADITVGETYFFRNVEQFNALTDEVLLERSKESAGRGTLRLLSAGCASGEEAYSLAMSARTVGGCLPVSVLGIDINPVVLQRARTAKYSAWSMRETPADVQDRWFTRRGREFALDPAIKAMARFEQRNLADTDALTWPASFFDVVFCRNTLMYFDPARAQEIVAAIARSLLPGGYLFLGHAETLRGLSTDFDLCHTHGTFYYRRRGATSTQQPAQAPPRAGAAAPTIEPASHEGDDSWVDLIRESADRIEALSAGSRSRRRPLAPRPAVDVAREPDLSRPMSLLHAGDFEQALALVDELGPREGEAVAIKVMRAALLMHVGRLHDASVEVHEILAVDSRSAAAHYLLSMCREAEGDRSSAAAAARTAIRHDSTFLMARVHLGLLARQLGRTDEARRHLLYAVDHLPTISDRQLMLFGGGFSRDALVRMCRTQLDALGGRR
jgi:chemotaxis protein methyltransferase CheR